MSGSTLPVLAAVSLGLLTGALAIEGLVLVPYWRSLVTDSFAELHAGFGPRLYRFFAPLTGGAVALAVVSALWAMREGRSTNDVTGRGLVIVAGGLALSLLAFYGLYFRAANERLPQLAAAGDGAGLTSELRRWGQVHRVRTIVSLAAFVLAVVGLAQ